MAANSSEWAGFNTKWHDLLNAAHAHGISPASSGAVYNLDLTRFQTNPNTQLSRAEAYTAISSAASGKPSTQAADPAFSWSRMPSYLGTDVKDFGVGLLGLMKKGIEDVVHPTQAGRQISALWRNPATAWNNLAELLPGVADVETILHADPTLSNDKGLQALAQHPFTSTLDVLPLADAAGRLAQVGARATLGEGAREAVTAAARFSPSDISAQAAAARAGARQAVPGALTRAAAVAGQAGESGLFGTVNRLTMDLPFSGETVGTYIARKLNTSTSGQAGPLAASLSRLYQGALRDHAAGVKEVVGDLGGFYERHGLADPAARTDFQFLLTHYRDDWESAYADRFGAEEIAHLRSGLAEYDDLAHEIMNRDLESEHMAVVTDPRTGEEQPRATTGDDGTVVRAHGAYTRARLTAGERAGRLADAMGAPVPLEAGAATATVAGYVGTTVADALRPFTSGFASTPGRIFEVAGTGTADAGALARHSLAPLAGRARELTGASGLAHRLDVALGSGDLVKAGRVMDQIIPVLRAARQDAVRAVLPAAIQARAILRLWNKDAVKGAFKTYATARSRLEKALDDHPEARYHPRQDELVTQALRNHLAGKDANVADLELLYAKVGAGLRRGEQFDSVIGAGEWAKITNSALAALRVEKAEGLNPRFIYTTRAEEIERLGTRRPYLERITQSRSVHGRGLNPAAIYDPVLGLLRREADRLQSQVAEELFYGEGGIIPRWGISEDDAQALALQLVKEPPGLMSHRAAIDAWINREYPTFDPHRFFPTGRVTGHAPTPTVRLPRDVYVAMEALNRAVRPAQNIVTSAIEGGTRVFRYSLLNFSPRYQAHIWLGGAVLGLIRAPSFVGHLADAFALMAGDSPALMRLAGKEAFKPVFEHLARKAERTGTTPGEMVRFSHELPEGDPQALVNDFRFATGTKLAAWMDQSSRLRGITDVGLHLAGFGANLLRSAVYLAGKAKGGEEEGMALVGKVFADMNSMTPLERSIIRYVMPFYGWTRHILTYVATLPVDHPWRAMVLSQLISQEWADWNSGVPQSMMYLFQLGSVQPDGSFSALDVRQLDPLRSVNDVFTLAGFASALNPAWQTLMAGFGINPSSGGPEQLYPTLTLNAFYGNEQAQAQSIGKVLASGVGSYLPEFSVADHFLGISSYTRWARANNHQAYENQLQSALNFPWVPEKINLNQVLAKTEIDRYNVARDAATAALADPNPNSPTWKALLAYAYVPYAGWLVQPSALRQWAFAQTEKAGYWDAAAGVATMAPSAFIQQPAAPKIG